MDQVVDNPTVPVSPLILDRPGWIPSHITENWDTNPYAYQTEEEMMPGGGPHGQILSDILEVLRHEVEARDRTLLLDVFLLYRDANGIKQRIGPDLMVIPHRDPLPSAYDLDGEQEPPAVVVEVTSPESRLADLEDKHHLYIDHLGVMTYIVLDGITARARVKEQIDLHVWHNVNSKARKAQANPEGRFVIPELGLWIATLGRRISFGDVKTNEVLFDVAQQQAARKAAELRAAQERLRAEETELQVAQERLRTEEAELQAAQERLRAEKAELRAEEAELQVAQERLRAEEAELRAEEAELQVAQERLRAEEAELQAGQERLRAERQAARLRELGIDPDRLT